VGEPDLRHDEPVALPLLPAAVFDFPAVLCELAGADRLRPFRRERQHPDAAPRLSALYRGRTGDRRGTIRDLPQKTLLGGLDNLVLPALSLSMRNGHALKTSYLRALTYVTAVHWPSLIMLVLLAHPVVTILLGPKWLEVVPLAQIISGAMILNFSFHLTSSTLIAAGAVHRVLLLYAVIVVSIAAAHSLLAVAWSMFIIMLAEVLLSLFLVRRSIPFTARELGLALKPSVVATAGAVSGPLLLAAVFGFEVPPVALPAAAALSAVGWFAGLRAAGHPLHDEILSLRDAVNQKFSRKRECAAQPAIAGGLPGERVET
jgi:hypothetical protein